MKTKRGDFTPKDETRTVLSRVKGWTPLLDSLVTNPRYGITGAAVFGVVWRYCQMSNRVCTASQEAIASRSGLSRKTVNVYIARLCEDGYLEDLTPDVKNRPHIYKDTGRLNLLVTVEAVEDMLPEDAGVTESYSTVTVGDSSVNVGYSKRQLKTEFKTERKKQKNNATTSRPLAENPQVEKDPPHITLFETVAEAIREQGREPNEDAILEACRRWKRKCEQAEQDGQEWNPANLDAILERYDLLTLSADPVPEWQGAQYFPVRHAREEAEHTR